MLTKVESMEEVDSERMEAKTRCNGNILTSCEKCQETRCPKYKNKDESHAQQSSRGGRRIQKVLQALEEKKAKWYKKHNKISEIKKNTWTIVRNKKQEKNTTQIDIRNLKTKWARVEPRQLIAESMWTN